METIFNMLNYNKNPCRIMDKWLDEIGYMNIIMNKWQMIAEWKYEPQDVMVC